MILRGTNYGHILNASGARGYFGELYWHQKVLNMFGLAPDFTDCTFVAKTTTFQAREGNMPMKKDGVTPKELFPECIVVNFCAGVMLNAVGLSGPGAEFLLEMKKWQAISKPFIISFMAAGKTPEERTAELRNFVHVLQKYLPDFNASVALQINFTCPNVGLDLNRLVDEVRTALKIASQLGIPLMPKFNVLTPIEAVKAICEDRYCDAICTSNTIRWDDLPKLGINRMKLFGSNISPLVKFGGGGLSGKPLLPLVTRWVYDARNAGIKKPVNAGGGILCAKDVYDLYDAGADSISVGCAATLRPWRVGEIIRRANQLFERGEKP